MSYARRSLDLNVVGGAEAGTREYDFLVVDNFVGAAPTPIKRPTPPTLASTGATGATAYEIDDGGGGDYDFAHEAWADVGLAGTVIRIQGSPSNPHTGNDTSNAALELDDRRGGAWTVIEPTTWASLPPPNSKAYNEAPDLSARVDQSDSAVMWEIRRPVSVERVFHARTSGQKVWVRGIRLGYQSSGVASVPYGLISDTPTASAVFTDLHFSQCTLEGPGSTGGNLRYANAFQFAVNNWTLTDSSIWCVTQAGRETHGVWATHGDGGYVNNCLVFGSSINVAFGFVNPPLPSLIAKNITFTCNHLKKPGPSEAWLVDVAKGGSESKTSALTDGRLNFYDGGQWVPGNSDQTNMQAIGLKNSGGGGGGPRQSGTTAARREWNLVRDYHQGGYVVNKGGASTTHLGCSNIVVANNLGHHMGPAAEGYVASGSPDTLTQIFKIFPSTSTYGRVGPDALDMYHNTWVADGDLHCRYALAHTTNPTWNADGAASRSRVVNNIYPNSDFGVISTDGGGEGGNGFSGLDQYGYEWHPGRSPNAHYPGSTWFQSGSDSRLTADYALTTAAISEYETALGVGAGGKAAEPVEVMRPDGTTYTPTVIGCDTAILKTYFGDLLTGANIASPSPPVLA